MDPVGAVDLVNKRRRSSDTNFEKCFICQNTVGCSKQDKDLRSASDEGIKCLQSRAVERQKYKDVKFVDVIDRIQDLSEEQTVDIKWHNSCYAGFTNVTAINRLKKGFESAREKVPLLEDCPVP